MKSFETRQLSTTVLVLAFWAGCRPSVAQETATELFAAATEAIAKDDYGRAQSLLSIAAVGAGADAVAKAEITDLRREAGHLSREFAKLARPLQTLKKSPSDADANEAVGRFYAFSKGDWERGLPYLARSSDESLRRAATLERNPPTKIDAQVSLGDLWRSLSQSEQDPAAVARATLRARHWYLAALEGLAEEDRKSVYDRLDTLRLYPTKIVLVNSHIGEFNDRGTQLADVKLLLDGNVVFTRRVKLPWKMGENIAFPVRLPRVRADAVQVDVLSWYKRGGALGEIEAYQDGENIALHGAAEASAIDNVQYGAELVTDGDWGEDVRLTGTWIPPGGETAWVRVYLDRR